MTEHFSERLRSLRSRAGITQQQLANLMFVDRSTVARWETGYRIPDLMLVQRLADCLGVTVASLLEDETDGKCVTLIVVDDEKVILDGNLKVLRQVLPEANITGFMKASEAVQFCRENHVNVAFLDIEMGENNGMSLSDTLLRIDPMINIIFVTAYSDYSLDAWKTQASGFLLKPLDAEEVRHALTKLRYPLPGERGNT